MELHAVGLSWDAWCRRNQMGRCSKAWNKMGTLHRCQKPAVWRFCRFENCCSYCCSLSMSGISMMLISTTRGDFAQPHGLETERDGNTAQMSATCTWCSCTLKNRRQTLQQYAQYAHYAQYAQYTFYIVCHTEGAGLHSVCSSWIFGCIVSSTSTI